MLTYIANLCTAYYFFYFQHCIRVFSLFSVCVEWPTLVRKPVCLKTELKSAVMLFKDLKWNNLLCLLSHVTLIILNVRFSFSFVLHFQLKECKHLK